MNIEAVAPAVFQTGKPPVDDLFSDLCDGRRLLQLLEGLVGHQLVRTRPLACPQSEKALLFSVTSTASLALMVGSSDANFKGQQKTGGRVLRLCGPKHQ